VPRGWRGDEDPPEEGETVDRTSNERYWAIQALCSCASFRSGYRGRWRAFRGCEALIFSFIVFNSKQHRNEVNAKVMSDPAMSPESMKDKPILFDMTRFSYGGFEVLVDA